METLILWQCENPKFSGVQVNADTSEEALEKYKEWLRTTPQTEGFEDWIDESKVKEHPQIITAVVL